MGDTQVLQAIYKAIDRYAESQIDQLIINYYEPPVNEDDRLEIDYIPDLVYEILEDTEDLKAYFTQLMNSKVSEDDAEEEDEDSSEDE